MRSQLPGRFRERSSAGSSLLAWIDPFPGRSPGAIGESRTACIHGRAAIERPFFFFAGCAERDSAGHAVMVEPALELIAKHRGSE